MTQPTEPIEGTQRPQPKRSTLASKAEPERSTLASEASPVRRHRQLREKPQILALALIGAGLLVFGVIALVVLPKPAATTGNTPSLSSAIPARVDFAAPSLSLTDLQGQSVSLADYLGQVVLVNNWATWCPPCKQEMPTLKAYFEGHRRQKFTVLAIEAGEPASEVANFVRTYGLTFPVWPDPAQKAMDAFHNDALPSSYVIDRSGRVRLAWTGAISREVLEKYITPLLEE
jgi:peroxiredoxin